MGSLLEHLRGAVIAEKLKSCFKLSTTLMEDGGGGGGGPEEDGGGGGGGGGAEEDGPEGAEEDESRSGSGSGSGFEKESGTLEQKEGGKALSMIFVDSERKKGRAWREDPLSRPGKL